MIARAIAFSARHSRWVIGAALLAALAGELGRRALTHDVLPDLADPQIAVTVDWMGHPATDVASDVTAVLTRALDGLPGSTAVRGSSMTGMAYVDVVFGPGRDLAQARQNIVDRIAHAGARLPETARVVIGPAASSTGWVFQYLLIDRSHGQPPFALRRLQDDQLRPALSAITGVAEVASVGGAVEEIVVEPQTDRLAARGVAFSDLAPVLRAAVAAHPDASAPELAALPLPVSPARAPAEAPRISDVARVRLANDAMPNGVADFDGQLAAVGGIVIAERNANLTALITRVRRALDEQRARLPRGVELVTVYDRLDLIGRVDRTLARAFAEEIAVVALVILIFLVHLRSAVLPLVTLPLVLLLTMGGMWLLGIPATVMSLGGIGIALGMAVDAEVVALDACHRRLEALGAGTPASERRAALVAATSAFAPAILVSLLIAALTFLPVLGFTGETGRLLRPLALTKTLVIAAAALVTLTLAPALRDRWLRGPVRPELDNPVTSGLIRLYRPFVQFALARPSLTLATAALALLSCVPIIPRLGAEFLPRVDEGDLLFMPTTRAGLPPHLGAVELRRQDQALAAFKEAATVFGKIGRADSATDPAPFSMAETTLRLLPRAEWPLRARPRWFSSWAPAPLRRALAVVWPEETAATLPELIESLDRATRLPGWTSAWTAPIRARIDMMSTGVRTPVGVRIVAARPDRLDILGAVVREIVARVDGARSATFEALGGETRLTFALDAAALAAHNVDPALARATADLILTGGQVGDVIRDGRRLRLRLAPELGRRGPADQLREATVRATGGPAGADAPVALGLVGRPAYTTASASLRTEHGQLVAYVYVDLDEGVNLARFVERARRAVDGATGGGAMALAPGERIEWTGQYQLLEAGERRLKWIAPAVVLSMLLLLLVQFRSLTEALIVLVSVPFALVGSVWSLFLLGYPLSAPVWVGLLSTIGLAMQTGVVMVVYIDAAFHRRLREGRLRTPEDIIEAHAEGTIQRLRPKLMTISTMAAALLPLLWAEGAGSEVLRRVAAPMVGGLTSSAFLTLEVLPVLYTIWRRRQLARASRSGRPLEEIVGRSPTWARSSL